MFLIGGVDACRGGWISIFKDLASESIFSDVFSSIESLLNRTTRPIALAIDIPIGLTDSGQRECDGLARKMLGHPRARSVFPAPIRPALYARNRSEADEITRSVDGRGVGAHAWGLYARIREVDQILGADPLARRIIYEVHPELSFMAWNGGIVLPEPKNTERGMSIRAHLVDSHFERKAREAIRQRHAPNLVGDDDISDAFAALWTAERIQSGLAQVIPNPPEIDSVGIEMGMWY